MSLSLIKKYHIGVDSTIQSVLYHILATLKECKQHFKVESRHLVYVVYMNTTFNVFYSPREIIPALGQLMCQLFNPDRIHDPLTFRCIVQDGRDRFYMRKLFEVMDKGNVADHMRQLEERKPVRDARYKAYYAEYVLNEGYRVYSDFLEYVKDRNLNIIDSR
jgi:hypothetical protein